MSICIGMRWVIALAIVGVGYIVSAHLVWAQAPGDGNEKTGEWKGTFDWSARQPVPAGTQYFSGHLDLTLDEYDESELKGSLTGNQTQKLDLTVCPSVALSPGNVAARLTGNLAQQQVTINVTERNYTPPQMSPCPNGGPPGTSGAIFVFPHFDEAFRSLTPVDKHNYTFDREWTVNSGRYPFTLQYTVKIERTRILPRPAD